MLGKLRKLLLLTGLTNYAAPVFFALRLYIGAYLIWGVWGSIMFVVRMEEFEGFLTAIGSPMPALAAPVSVWAQFLIGALLIPGLLTRAAGLLLTVNFLVAVCLIGTSDGVIQDIPRELFGPMMCVLAGLLLATHGAGRYSLDARLTARADGPT